MRSRVHGGLPQLVGVHFAQALEAVDVHLHIGVAAPQLGGDGVPLLVGEGHPGGLAAGQLIQRRHGGVNVAMLNQGPHKAEEESQQQGTDMGAVHIGIGHDDDLVVPQLGGVKFIADTGAQGGNDRLKFVVAVHLVRPGLFHVQHLAPQGKDGLEPGIPALGSGAACGVALDDVDFGQFGIVLIISMQGYQLVRKKTASREMFYLGIMAILLGVWRLTDTRLIALLLPGQAMALGYITIGALVLSPIPLLLFLKERMANYDSAPLLHASMVLTGASLMILLLQVLDIADFKEMLMVCHIMLAGTAAAVRTTEIMM